jgi:hypothetical protein
MTDWLSRQEVDQIAENISADDLIEAMDGTGTQQQQGVRMVKTAFNGAAARLGIEEATTRVRASDFKYLADRIGEVVNVDSPLSESTEDLLVSADIGG